MTTTGAMPSSGADAGEREFARTWTSLVVIANQRQLSRGIRSAGPNANGTGYQTNTT